MNRTVETLDDIDLDAVAEIPDALVAASAVASMPAMSPLRAGVWAPYWAPALAAFVRDWEV